MYKKVTFRWTKHADFILIDIICMFSALLLAYALRFPDSPWALSNMYYSRILILMLLSDLFICIFTNQFKGVLKRGAMVEFGHVLWNTLTVFSVIAVFLFSIQKGLVYSRLVLVITMIMYTIIVYPVRLLYKNYYVKFVVSKSGKSLIIAVTSDRLETIAARVKNGGFNTYRIAGLALMDTESEDYTLPDDVSKLLEDNNLTIVANKANIEDYVRVNWVDEILLSIPLDEELTYYSEMFTNMGITVHVGLSFCVRLLPEGIKHFSRVGGFDTITVAFNTMTGFEAALKRFIDIIGSLVRCIFVGILFVVLGPIIYKASPGPIFFVQNRVGQNGKIFKMYKFRSMVMNADELKQKYMDQNRVSDGMMFKLDWDPRIIGNKELPNGKRKTGIGEFIRKTSLDEFPQFINVLKGEMSLVGTRPPTLDEWEKYQGHHRARMAMKPGITGMWQVSGRSDITDFEEVVRLDKKYIAEWTPLLDLKILVKTVLVVLRHEGSM